MNKTQGLRPNASNRTKIEKETNELVEFMYGKFHEFPAEEKWATVIKLRNSANDLLFYVSQAVGNLSPSGAEYEWSIAHKNAHALRTMYIFATDQKYIELEPEIVVKIDQLKEQIRKQSQESSKLAEAVSDKELEHWRKKYKIWKAMDDES